MFTTNSLVVANMTEQSKKRNNYYKFLYVFILLPLRTFDSKELPSSSRLCAFASPRETLF